MYATPWEHRVLADEQVFVREFYGRPSNPAGFNWFREIVFKLGMEHPVVFRCGVLGIASHMQARFQGHVETMVQDVQSLHLIRSHFEASPNDCSDSAIMMCIFRSLFDDFQGNLIASWTHLRAATQMIRQRGGPEAFRDNALIASVANCYAYRMRGYVQGAMLAHMKYPISESPHTDWPSIDTYEVALVREELIQFLYAVEKLTLSQRNAWQSRRRTFFDRNSVFHQAMSSPYKVFGSFPSLQNHTMFGLSILLHFNAALLDFQHDQDLCELFFHDLDTRIKETKLDAGIRLESLAQFLIYPTPNSRLRPAQFDRLWKVGRLLQVAKRLCAKSFHQLWETLEAYLTFDEPPQSIFEWEDDLRDEILQAPPTKLVSGILQEASPRQEVDYIEVCF